MTFQPDRMQDEGTYRYTGPEQGDVTLRSFYYGFIKTFNEALIQELRNFIETNPRAICFRDETGGIIHIGEAWPTEPQKYPAIMVERTDASLQDLFLAGKQGALYIDYGNNNLKEVGERLGGRVKLNTSLKLATFNTPQRDALADLILYALVGPVKWNLTYRGFVQVPNSANIGPENVENPEQLGQALYTRSIGFSVESEWFDDFYYNGVEIQGFNLIFEPTIQVGG